MTSELAYYKRALTQSHQIRVLVRLYDHEENYLSTLDDGIVSGQVDVDTTRDVERSLHLVLADVDKRFRFDHGGADERAIYGDRFIRVDYMVWVHPLSKWVREPIFFGPLTRFQRDGFELTIEAQDKSSLLQQPVVWGRFLRNAGLGFVDDDTRYAAKMIRAILATTGETEPRLEFGSFSDAKLPRDFKLPKHPETLWRVLKRIVHAANARSDADNIHDFRLFYDGRGRLRVESMSTGGFTFTDDPYTSSLASKPQVDYDLSNFRNTVVVRVNRGQDGRQLQPVIRTLPKGHPLSAYSLRRNGKPRYIVQVVDNNNIKSRERARAVARRTLRRLSTETVSVSFDCLPVPHLTPGARCRIEEGGDVHRFHATRYTLPLRATDLMSVGYLKRTRSQPYGGKFLPWPARKTG